MPSDTLRAILRRTSSSISKRKRARDAVGKFLPNEMLRESGDVWSPAKSRRNPQRGKSNSAEQVASLNDVSPEDEQTGEEDRSSTAIANEDNEAGSEHSVSEEDEKTMRADLTILLYRELFLDDDNSHTKLPNAESMLETSKQLDDIIRNLWTRGEDKIRVALGDSFEQAYRTLHAWLSWREGCWSLCHATGVHPLERKPTPRFTLTQWEQKLGGGEECRKFHQTLMNHRRTLLASKIHGDEDTALSTAKCLSRVFAGIAGSPILEYSLRGQIVTYNELLFAWDLDLWM
ncbi:uncharacterized protein N0V89_008834 [Didymosphaeria variabile]|uniref:Uncharacterized protein n=1 Tax=Didymosphaeria variabile TaxID=1932322 RepID=A0A9W9C968_9PLEO|nr:uncharacterized protein N0V89_008834 [Didymosphaeria variabile]KAJ4350213.1 hypothetical protein N0V89_008834 [Didymosphaeria variabile]